jgi:NAD(P)-dependent dehydrogenase (short-subunit alcohol dehydrogenase family)
MKKALIFGVSGQDGAYLAKLLLSKGYTVYGTSRDAQVSSFRNLEYLGIREQVQLESAALNDFRSVLQVLKKTRAWWGVQSGGSDIGGVVVWAASGDAGKYCGGDAEYFGGDAVYGGAD